MKFEGSEGSGRISSEASVRRGRMVVGESHAMESVSIYFEQKDTKDTKNSKGTRQFQSEITETFQRVLGPQNSKGSKNSKGAG